MSDRPSDRGLVSRRKVLYALTAAGATGAFVGVGTGAILRDTGRFSGQFVTGTVDLDVYWDAEDGGSGHTNDGNVSLDLGTVEKTGREHGESVDFTLGLPQDGDAPNNPAYLWFQPSCVDGDAELLDHLVVSLRYVDCDDGDDGDSIAHEIPLQQFIEDFRDGHPLDANGARNPTPGTQDEVSDQVCLRLDYFLADAFEGTGSATVDLAFVATQARNHDGTENPFGSPGRLCDAPPEKEYHGISYVEVFTCDAQGSETPIGKLELSESYVDNCLGTLDVTGDDDADGVPDHQDADWPADDGDPETAGLIGENVIAVGRYDLPADGDDPSCADSGYDIVVTDTDTKDGGAETTAVAFEILDANGDPGPDVCKVVVRGGGDDVDYGPSDLDGNATRGLLYAPEKN